MMQTAERCFAASIENIPRMVAFVSDTSTGLGVHRKRVMHLELATEEAVTNICSYAYEVPPGELCIRICRTDRGVQVDLTDNGVPFDPLAMDAPDLTAELENREIGGLGIFLIRRLLDEVHYSRWDNRNILSLVVKHENA